MKSGTSSFKRINALELYRFVFSLIIALLHFRSGSLFGERSTAFYGGYLAVDFFFIVSGYFLAQSFFKDSQTNTTNNTKEEKMSKFLYKKFLHLYPAFFASLCISAAIKIFIFHDLSIKEMIKYGVWEALMLTGLGFPSAVSGIFWFVSALFISSFVVYWLVLSFKHIFLRFGSITLALIIYSQIYQQVGHIDIGLTYGPLMTWGTWRGIAGLSVGCFLFYMKYETKTNFKFLNLIPNYIITCTEIFLFVTVITVMWGTRRDIKDFIMIFILSILVLFAVSEKSGFSNILNNNISSYLGKMSYGIYVNQVPFLFLFKRYFPAMHSSETDYWFFSLLFLVCVFVSSVITTKLNEKLLQRFFKLNFI